MRDAFAWGRRYRPAYSLLLKKHRTRQQCQLLARRFLRAVYQLRQAGLQLVQLGETLHA